MGNAIGPGSLRALFAFAEQMLADMEPGLGILLDSYDDLCVLFQIEEGQEGLYHEHKHAVSRNLLYLKPAGALASKGRLDQLFHALFAQEFELVKGGHVPDARLPVSLGIITASIPGDIMI